MGQRSEWAAMCGGQRSGRTGRRGRPWPLAGRLAVLGTIVALAAGCGSRPLFGEVGRQCASYDYKGEKVELRMLTGGELWDYSVTGKDQEELRNRLKTEFPVVFDDGGFTPPGTGQMRAEVAGLAAVVPLIAGFAVDAVRSELEKEAGIHEAQFGKTIHETGFWEQLAQEVPAPASNRIVAAPSPNSPNTPTAPTPANAENGANGANGATTANEGSAANTASTTNPATKPSDENGARRRTFGTPRWLGFEIVRKTAATQDPKSTVKYASRMVCVMVPAPYMKQPSKVLSSEADLKMIKTKVQDPSADPRLFVIKPLLYEVRRSKAKLMWWEERLNATVNIALDATWIDDHQTVHQAPVATAGFEIEDYNLKDQPIYIKELEGQIAGWFGGVPVSTEPGHPDQLNGNGTFRLAVALTERDPSLVKESIERAAKYLKDNKSQIVQQISGTK